eukprot:6010358-Amphidinium_carterae.1
MPDLVLHSISILPVWIGTKHNPADDPTRGQKVRSPTCPAPELGHQIASLVSQAEFVYYMAHLQWSDCHVRIAIGAPRPRRLVCSGCCQTHDLQRCAWCDCYVCVACISSCLASSCEIGWHVCHGRGERRVPDASQCLSK